MDEIDQVKYFQIIVKFGYDIPISLYRNMITILLSDINNGDKWYG